MKLQAPPGGGPDQAQILRQILAAEKRGDTAEAERLQARADQLRNDAEIQWHQRLQKEYGHADLIQKWTGLNHLKDWKQRETGLKQEIAPLLGQWPAERADDLLAVGGYAFQIPSHGTTVTCRFAHTDPGLLTMARWLFAQGVRDVRYQISGFSARTVDDGADDE